MRHKKTLRNFVITLIIGLILFSKAVAHLLIDGWWYQDIGNFPYFVFSLELQIFMFGFVFALMALPSFLSIYLSRRLAPMRIRVLSGNILEFPEHLIRPYLFPLLYIAGSVVAFLAALQGASNWSILLPLFSHPTFGISDPIFKHDLRFYLFFLPLLEFFYQIGITSLIMATALAFVSYSIQKVLIFQDGVQMAPVATIHLSILLGLLALVKGFGYTIGLWDLLLNSDGVVFGVGYADQHAVIPILEIGIAVALGVALLLFANIFLKNWKPILAGGAIWAVVSLFLLVYPKIVQQFQVIPSELDKERPYLANMISFTRKAYDLENIQTQEIHPAATLSPSDLKAHQATLENIRLWDSAPLLQSLAQLQEIRPYYKFVSADVDRYTINGRLQEVMISARELDYGHLQNPTWTNDHLIFTHGYGFVCTPVNRVTPEGLPDFFIQNIPPTGLPELEVSNPKIYYGEVSNNYCLVNTKQEEFDYPSGSENRYTHYAGTGGVLLNSFWKRLIFGYGFSYQIFFSSDITPSSKILYYRSIRERLKKAFPLLIYDSDPYLVVANGKLYWICDAYTTNDHFPYAQPVEFHGDFVNYIRNSVKVVIDAYNGTLTYYVVDTSDPMIQMYEKIFPKWFHAFSEMPSALKSHIRVPEDYFIAQANVYASYHMTNPDVFYNQEDLWEFPRSGEEQKIEPYYVIMQLPGEKKPEFLLMLPFTPNKKDNLAAWFAARCDPPNYGKRLVYEFSKERLVFGPSQIQARINQDPRFSQLRTLWGQQGSQINVGHLQVIPVGNAMLYVEPLYLQSERRALPELKLVLLAFGNKIVMEENLEKAFASLWGTAPKTKKALPLLSSKPILQITIQEALLHYKKAMEDERNGDWAGYGREIQKVGKILERLSQKH
jgi:uncharacterized membrane protein (UPF0182 family)